MTEVSLPRSGEAPLTPDETAAIERAAAAAASRAKAPTGDLLRFDATERAVHWVTAVLLLSLLFTGSVLYIPELALTVGHRGTVEEIHVISGIALLVPLAVGLAGPWRRRLLADLRRFDRFDRSDFDWFRRPMHRKGFPRGKFNGGQKLEAAFLGAAMAGTLVTGLIMRFAPSSWVRWATGATLVHDTLYLAIGVAVLAHVAFALSRPDQMVSMLKGRIPRAWAHEHAPRWLEEVDGPKGAQPRRK